MSGSGSNFGRVVIAALVLAGAARGASGQVVPTELTTRAADATALERYLADRGLKAVLAEHLAARLAEAPADERPRLMERLGRTYVDLLATATNAEARTQWEERARVLLKSMPEGQGLPLRVELARTVYSKAESQAELFRIGRLAEAERPELERTLRASKLQFENLGADANRRTKMLEGKLESGRSVPADEEELAESRRVRSVAYYYAGWAGVYVAVISGTEQPAVDSLKAFGWITGRGAYEPAQLEKLPRSLLKHEHIARASIGVAMAFAAVGRQSDAMAWLDVVEQDDSVSPAVRAQLPMRRIGIIAAAQRWNDLERYVVKLRAPRPLDPAHADGQPVLLSETVARYLAVICLQAGKSAGGVQTVVERLAQIAVQDLIAGGHTGQVLELAKTYGTTTLGATGFVPTYVRGVMAYEAAIALIEPGPDAAAIEPATDPDLINKLREAGSLLDAAVTQDDAGKFGGDVPRALLSAGRAYYFAGDSERAADRFARGHALADARRLNDVAEESLWFAVLSLDRLAKSPEATAAVDERLDQLSLLFLRSYPQTTRAAQIVIRRSERSGIADDQAVKTLLAVGKDQPVYETARRQAARLLYRMFRTATTSGGDRNFAAQRFVQVADELLGLDFKAATRTTGKSADEGAARAVLLARQLLDTLLAMSPPDGAKAAGVLDTLTAVLERHPIDTSAFADELLFRKFQLALARQDQAQAERFAEQLVTLAAETRRANTTGSTSVIAGSSRFALSAQRALYLTAVDRFRRTQQGGARAGAAVVEKDAGSEAAAEVQRFGGAVIEQFGGETVLDNSVLSVREEVAGAGEYLWLNKNDSAARDVAIRLDKGLMQRGKPTLAALRRLAILSETIGDTAIALEAWRQLGAGLQPATEQWYRAKYESIRLLALTDKEGARQSLAQHKVLYPTMGTEPWGGKLRELDAVLGPPVDAAAGDGPATKGGS